MKKEILLMMAIAIALSGCHGSDPEQQSTSSDSSTSSYSPTIKAIDGYLVNAEIYVDRNEDGIADTDEKLSDMTNNKGEADLSVEDRKYPVIIRAVAGKTYDTDEGGRVKETFELTAEAGSEIISPFSTLAKLKGVTLEELANTFDLPINLLGSDYISSTDTQAKEIHLLARSLTGQLDEHLTDSKLRITAINTSFDKIKEAINGEINKNTDLDSIVIDGNGGVVDYGKQPTVENYLKGKEFIELTTFAHDLLTMSRKVSDMGLFYVQQFTEDKLITKKTDGKYSIGSGDAFDNLSIRYGKDSNKYYYQANGEEVDVEMLYRHKKFAVIAKENNHIFVLVEMPKMSESSAETSMVKMASKPVLDLVGQTYYMLYDKSLTEKPDAQKIKVSFVSDRNVTITTHDGKESITTWSFKEDKEDEISGLTIDAVDSIASIQLVLLTSDKKPLSEYLDTNMLVGVMELHDYEYREYNVDYSTVLMVKNSSVANNIYAIWRQAESNPLLPPLPELD